MIDSQPIEIIVHPRIHITLIGMGDGSCRSNGGVGFAINHPSLSISLRRADIPSIVDCRNPCFSTDAIDRIISRIEFARRKYGLVHNVSCVISGESGVHSGFGSTTSVRLACLEGLFLVNGLQVDQKELVDLSDRGGTSGIGIQTYFSGGFVFDIGQRSNQNRGRPSSANEDAGGTALPVVQCRMPEWPIGIVVDKRLGILNEQQELEHFSTVCPVSDESVMRTLYHSVYGIVGAVMENDRTVFCEAIRAIQKETWKSSEIGNYSPKLNRYIKTLNDLKATVGMSSMGPLLYFLADDVDETTRLFQREHEGCIVRKVCPINSGRTIGGIGVSSSLD